LEAEVGMISSVLFLGYPWQISIENPTQHTVGNAAICSEGCLEGYLEGCLKGRYDSTDAHLLVGLP
jgi:hypothetical protein